MSDNPSAARAATISLTCGALLTLVACGGGSGSSGASSVVTALHENAAPIGTCPNGGAQLDSGIDDNRNGTLDAEEIDQTQYICNGTDGQNTLVAVTTEPAGTNCATGGSKVEAGLDLDSDGVLDAGEITSTTYVCTGPQGPGVSWVEATGDVQAEANTGYMTSSDNLVTVTLPAFPAVGDVVKVSGIGTGGWKIAQNPGQAIRTIGIASSIGQTWHAGQLSSAKDFAMSADGKKLVAVVLGGQIYTSTDYGVTWTARDSVRDWRSVASSADGIKLVAGTEGGQVYTSSDSGVTWTARDSNRRWRYLASSSDGTKLVAATANLATGFSDFIYTSTDSGVTWAPHSSSQSWLGVASSADGTRLVAGATGGLFASYDSALNWTQISSSQWARVASSANGSRLAAASWGGNVAVSTDYGSTWPVRDADRVWSGITMSADGTQVVATTNGGYVYVSTDSGLTFQARGTARAWEKVVSSSDGIRLVARDITGQLFHSIPETATGTTGAILGDQFESVELQYIGNDTFTVLSHEGDLTVE